MSRIKEFGEVFTPLDKVERLIGLIEDEVIRVDSRFLEPACGNGVVLDQILKKRLKIVYQRYSRSQLEFERNAFKAIGNLYGVEILKDNVQEARCRLESTLTDFYRLKFKSTYNDHFLSSVAYLINKNIIWGDFLSMTQMPDNKKGLEFSEWSFVKGSLVKRRDYIWSCSNNSMNCNPNSRSLNGDFRLIRDFVIMNFLELGKYD